MKAYIALPAVAALVYRAYSRKSLTPLGIASAGMTGLAHALHPFSLPFALLFVFYFGCMRATRVKHEIKAKLTLNAAGGTGGEGTRIHTQVFANSLSGSLLCIMYALHYYLDVDEKPRYGQCWTWGAGASTQDVLLVGIIANYAAVTADTFSSELGILSTKPPRLITSRTFKRVPHGTNGGVSSVGTLAGVLEAFLIAVATVILLPVCDGWSAWQNLFCLCTVTSCGLFGTLIDSFLGGCLQETIIDSDTGKVLEANGGKRARLNLASEFKKQTVIGNDYLDNNDVNLLTGLLTTLGAMFLFCAWWDLPLDPLLPEILVLLCGGLLVWRLG